MNSSSLQMTQTPANEGAMIAVSFGAAWVMNIEVIQRYQNKVLKCIVITPSYV
jgi:hypothetical protein